MGLVINFISSGNHGQCPWVPLCCRAPVTVLSKPALLLWEKRRVPGCGEDVGYVTGLTSESSRLITEG